jgi:hypothetical protein
MRTLWTKERRQIYIRMREAGYTHRQIANALDLEYSQVKSFSSKLGRVPNRRGVNTQKRSDQLCWLCKYAGGARRKDGWKCPWADRLKPVEGWTAEAVPYYDYNNNRQLTSRTWRVTACPEYENG